MVYAKWVRTINNEYSVEHYNYRSNKKAHTLALNDCDYDFIDEIDIPGMPETKENDFLNNYGKLESETLAFDSINMYVNKTEQYKFIMKDDCSLPLDNLIDLVFFFDDAFGNQYKQTISVIYNETGFHFMPQAVENRKKRNV